MEPTKYSKIYRIMHWAIALTFILLLITIFLRLTWLNKHNVSNIIQDYLSNNNLTLTEDQSIILAKKIRKPMWDWHIYLGYILTGLFSIRFLLPAFGFMKIQNPLDKKNTTKMKFQKWTYILFYICVVISLVTGLIIVLGPKEYKKTMEGIHEFGTYYLVGFIALHIGGVLIAESTNDKGIISRIINGSEGKE